MDIQVVSQNTLGIIKQVNSDITTINRSIESINTLYNEGQEEYAIEKMSVQKTVNSLLTYLVSLQVDSYYYSVGTNYASQNLDYNDTVILDIQSIIDDYISNLEKSSAQDKDIEVAFTAYYVLFYMFHLHERDKQKRVLDEYEHYFLDRFALAYQIRGRELRDRKLIKEAIQNDKIALNKLKEKNMENIGVKVTLASSMAIGLEENIIDFNDSEVKQAIENVVQAIQLNRKYAKYHYLLSVLRLEQVKKNFFAFVKSNYDGWNTDDKWEQELDEAERSIQTALDLLNEKSPTYTGFFVLYRLTLDRIKTVQSYIQLVKEIELKHRALRSNVISQMDKSYNEWKEVISNKTSDDTKIALHEFQKQFQEELKETQTRYLEILAVFVAIVGVMMTMIGLLSHNYKIQEVLAGMIVMNSGLIVVYSFFKIILSNKISKLALLAILFGCALIYYGVHIT